MIGYSGHALICLDVAVALNYKPIGYFEKEEKYSNPFGLTYFGRESEDEFTQLLQSSDYFIGIGDGQIRKSILKDLSRRTSKYPPNLIHPQACVSPHVKLEDGLLVSAGAIVNACAKLQEGCIVNSNATVEHECVIGEYAHIAPGATLCGNVSVGPFTHVGANAVVRENIKICAEVRIGAGAVVVNDILSPGTYVGVPACRVS